MKKGNQERDAEFVAICLEIIRRSNLQSRNVTLTEVLYEAINRSPRCHYVSYDYASRVLHLIERAGITAIPPGLRRLRWQEMYNQLRHAMDGPRALPFDRALSFVLCFCRPSRFYIDATRALRLLKPHVGIKLVCS